MTYLGSLINLIVAIQSLIQLLLELLRVILELFVDVLIVVLHLSDVLVSLLRAADLFHEAVVLERTVTVVLARRVLGQLGVAHGEALPVPNHLLVPRLHFDGQLLALRYLHHFLIVALSLDGVVAQVLLSNSYALRIFLPHGAVDDRVELGASIRLLHNLFFFVSIRVTELLLVRPQYLTFCIEPILALLLGETLALVGLIPMILLQFFQFSTMHHLFILHVSFGLLVGLEHHGVPDR